MTEWKEYKLGEVAEITSSKRIFYSEYVPNGVPFYRSKEIIDLYNKRNVSTELFISEKRFKEIIEKFGAPKEDDILLTSVGSLGIPYKVKPNDRFYFKDGNLTWFKDIDKEKLLPDYLMYWLSSGVGKQKLEEITIGSTQAAFTISGLKTIIIEIPSINTQRQITSILTSLDDKIDLLRREKATLESMAETLFRQWFVVEAKEEWEEGKLGDILTVKGGTTPSTKEPSYWDGDIAWTSPRDVTTLKGLYLFETEKRITQKGLEQISSGLLPAGTLLMSSRAPVGVLAFAEIPLAINQGYIAILDDKGYPKEFIYLWLKANMDLVHSYSNGSTFMEISKSAFKSLDISIPSKGEVDCFVSEVKPYFEKIRTNEIQIRTLTKTRDGLLLRLMGGEIKI